MPKDHICTNCGKNFPTPSKLQTHQNKKIPCVLPVEPDNKCAKCDFCDKIYSDKYHLNKHQKTCRKKAEHDAANNNVFTHEDLKREREEHKKEVYEFMQVIREMNQTMQKMVENKTASTVINGDVGTINNITVNDYRTPTLPDISFEEIKDCDGLHKLMLKKLYFNIGLPENHSLYVINKADQHKTMAVYGEDGWGKLVGTNLDNTLQRVSDTAFKIGNDILENNRQIYVDAYNKCGRPIEFKTRIANFKQREEMAESKDIFEMAVEFSPKMKKPKI